MPSISAMKKILVTGATGFVGRQVIHFLADYDVQLFLVVRKGKERVFHSFPQVVKIITTNDLFAELKIDEVKKLNNSDFLKYYKEDLEKNSFPKIFKSYFDDKNPVYFEENEIDEPYSLNQNHIDFFSEENVAENNSLMALINDIHLIKSIANDFIDASSFDYDGKTNHKKNSRPYLGVPGIFPVLTGHSLSDNRVGRHKNR